MSTDLLKFDVRYIELATDRLQGMAMEDLSMKYCLPPFRIAEVLDLPEVKRFSDTMVQNIGYNNRLKRAQLLERIVDKKVAEMEEADIWSRKDIIEILKVAQDEDKLLSPKVAASPINVNVENNNYKTFMQDLLAPAPPQAVEAQIVKED